MAEEGVKGRVTFLRYIDLEKCMGCYTCQAVCDFLHDGKPYIVVYETSIGLKTPISCMHCSRAPCIEVCPTGAMTRDESGAVYVDQMKCIGCMACLYACPFGIPELDPELRVATKCDLCRPLRKQGLEPACYAMCPAEAIIYGEPKEVSERIKKRKAEQLVRAKMLDYFPSK